MDTATLVDKLIDEGKLLVDDLKSSGVDVTVAFWVLTSEDNRWSLYIATPLVESEGMAGAYRKIYGELLQSQIQWVERTDIRLIGDQNPLAQDALNYRNSALATRYGGRKLGNLIIDAAYIYPADESSVSE